MVNGRLRSHHVVASAITSRSTLPVVTSARALGLIGAGYLQLGTIEPGLVLDPPPPGPARGRGPVISPAAPVILLAAAIVMTAAAALYFRLVRLPRPAAGRFTRSDVTIMTVLLIALPFGYVHLATPLLVAVFGVHFLAAVQTTLAPLTGGRAGMLVAAAACAGVLAAGLSHHLLLLMWGNDLLIAVAVVGIVDLWMQTGMTAAQGAVLAVYDLIATGTTTFTATFFGRISGEPFAPAFAGSHGTMPVALGLGDCLMVALWPLAAAKAHGRVAGWTGAVTGLAGIAVIEAGSAAGWITGNVPVLTIIGPLAVAQWVFWRLRPVRNIGTKTGAKG